MWHIFTCCLSRRAVSPSTVYPVRITEPNLIFADAEVDSSLPSFSAVRTLQICPYQPDLILAGGHDGTVRVSAFVSDK